MGRWSALVAGRFLAWLGPPGPKRVLDVGCGTGALTAAVAEAWSPDALLGVDPSPAFLAGARVRLGAAGVFAGGSAEALPVSDGWASAAVSGLALNFVPDQSRAVAELARVTEPGGTVAVYVWDYAGGMELLHVFWTAAARVDLAAAALDEGSRFPVCRPEPLGRLMAEQLVDVEVDAVTVRRSFASFGDYWEPFLGGQGAAGAYCATLDEEVRERLREQLRDALPTAPDGSITLNARAWAARGRVPSAG